MERYYSIKENRYEKRITERKLGLVEKVDEKVCSYL
jgi:hypothetical protein